MFTMPKDYKDTETNDITTQFAEDALGAAKPATAPADNPAQEQVSSTVLFGCNSKRS